MKQHPFRLLAELNTTLKLRSASHKFRSAVLLLVQLLLAVCLIGCKSLPSVAPFVDASKQLRSAVATSGTTVVAELRLMAGGSGDADNLQTSWKARNAAFVGMVEYANSLNSIVDAGNKGAASAEKVADSVSNLAKAVGVALPGSPEAIGVVTDVAKFISAQIALARAAKSLEEAMVTAQPAIETIASLIASDLHDLESIFVSASKKNDNAVRTSDEFKDLLGYRLQLLKQIKMSDPADLATLDKQVQLAEMLQGTQEWYSTYLAKRKAIDDRLRYGRALIQTALQSANTWGLAHGNLIVALKNRQPVNTDSLVNAAVEIQELVRKVREL